MVCLRTARTPYSRPAQPPPHVLCTPDPPGSQLLVPNRLSLFVFSTTRFIISGARKVLLSFFDLNSSSSSSSSSSSATSTSSSFSYADSLAATNARDILKVPDDISSYHIIQGK
ncbi:hypothetical protein A2U01_0044113, partial [Trifolium medium]|nr:hypothetical protein [Trifolium medium]